MQDHARGCEGRNYTCTCGYDENLRKKSDWTPRWNAMLTRVEKAEAEAQVAEDALAEAVERLKAIINWADLAMKHPGEFDSHGVQLLNGPVFDEARALIAKAESKP